MELFAAILVLGTFAGGFLVGWAIGVRQAARIMAANFAPGDLVTLPGGERLRVTGVGKAERVPPGKGF